MAHSTVKNEAAEATVSAVASKFTYGGGTAALIGGFTANEIAAFGGLVVAAIGLAVQWYYKRKEDRRNEALYRARLEDLRE